MGVREALCDPVGCPVCMPGLVVSESEGRDEKPQENPCVDHYPGLVML